MEKMQVPKGTKDMLPSEAYKWHYVEDKFRKISSEYGLREIRTPIFEHTELFKRGVGETTDVVQKEMYTFEDKGGRSITLKPEGTAPTVRSFIENSMFNEAQPTKLFYITPAFRYEKMQKGRLRQFHQYGIEILGSKEASIDAEVISLAMRALDEFGVKDLSLNINSLGCPECRQKYNEALKAYLEGNLNNLCETCNTRFEKNPMRIIDCKERKCKEIVKNAPVILDFICDECKDHFEDLQKYLNVMDIKFNIDPQIVRGLDYYSKTVFEIINNGLTVCGGGRYDALVSQIGGPEMPAVGFGLGIERLLMLIEENNAPIEEPVYMDLFIGSIGENANLHAVKLAYNLRKLGVKCDVDHMNRKVKAQMKFANKINATYTMILGDDEITNGKATLKRMSDGEVKEVDITNLEELVYIKNK